MTTDRHLSFYHLLSAEQITKKDIDTILHQAAAFHRGDLGASEVAKGKILGSLFFEPSTRTRLSFEAAMLRLGGGVSTVVGESSSSLKKGESLSDMARIVSGYCDIIAMRHPEEGSVDLFSSTSSVPVINAGDGANQHPSQALVDLYTIYHIYQRLHTLSIGFVGDLKYGRTVHSLTALLALFPNQTLYFVSHPSLKISEKTIVALRASGHRVIETDQLDPVIPEVDVLYVTRVQQERFESEKDYLATKNGYRITPETLSMARSHLSILHPLPRTHEICPQLDHHRVARYFDQARYGLFVRMALLAKML